jgi:ArsR family transcriptional regulator
LTYDPAALFQSVSDPSRLRLLRLLAGRELNVQELVRTTGLSQPRVSKHLAVLRDQGWITQRREGTFSWYETADPQTFAPGEDLFRLVLATASLVAEAAGDDRILSGVLAERQARRRDFFAGIAHRWDEIRQEYEHPDIRLDTLGALVDPRLRVLDIGTGTGAMLPVFDRHVALTVALDSSAAMLARAGDLSRTEGLSGIRFCNGDVSGLPFQDGTFDAINCSMVLHHVPDPAAAVAEMTRVLTEQGRIMVTGFCPHGEEWMRDELAHRWLGFSRDQLQDFFCQARLQLSGFLVRGRRVDQEGPATKDPTGKAIAWPEVFLATGRRI